jgi:membrane protein YdbS with pleckstrin-like domain
VLSRWFLVPAEPPGLPAGSGEPIEARRPAEGFLRYLKLKFWVVLLAVDGVIIVAWLAFTFAESPIGGALLAPLVLGLVVLPDVVAYAAIHLRYDSTWYVMSGRSLRIRRGIWVIREITITFENVQNIRVEQGPLQRYFRIANVIVETAGGGSRGEPLGPQSGHEGVIEGVANAHQVRDKIVAITKLSKSAGIGDEPEDEPHESPRSSAPRWSPEELSALREIRDSLAAALGSRTA